MSDAQIADVTQAIHITHNPVTGRFDARLENLGGLDALSILGEVLYAEYVYSFKVPEHKPIAGYGKVCIELVDGQLSLRFGTGDTPQMVEANPMRAKAMLLQAWLYLCEQTSGGTFDARQALIEGLHIEGLPLEPQPTKKKRGARGNRNDTQCR